MPYANALVSPHRFQWESSAAPSQAYNCGPACVTKIAQFYKDTWYGIQATRRLATADLYRGTSANEQQRMLALRGISCFVTSIDSLYELHSLVDSGRRPVLIGMNFARVPWTYADHPFRGWHAVTVLSGGYLSGARGFWINDPNFSPPGGHRTDPDGGRKWYPDWVIQQALLNNYPRWAVVPSVLKTIVVPKPTAKSGLGRVNTPTGNYAINICTAPGGAVYARAQRDGYTYRVSDGRRLWANGSAYNWWGWTGDWANCTTGSGMRLYIHRAYFTVTRPLAGRADAEIVDEPEAREAAAFDIDSLPRVGAEADEWFDEPVPSLEEQDEMSLPRSTEDSDFPGAETFRAGERAAQSGLYIGTRGGTEIALSREDRFPPPLVPGAEWMLIRPTERMPHEALDEE